VGQSEMSKKELFDLCRKRTGLEAAENMEPGLNVLIQRGYIRVEKHLTGGRPTEIILLNPLAQKAQKAQKP